MNIEVLKAAAGVFLVKVSHVFLSICLTVFLTRELGVAEFGIYAGIWSVSTILAALMSGGLCVYILKELPIALHQMNLTNIDNITGNCYRIVATFSLVSFAIFVLVFVLAEHNKVLAVLMLSPLILASRVRSSIIRSVGNTVESQLEFSIVFASTILISTSVAFFGMDLQALHVVAYLVFSFLLVGINRAFRIKNILPESRGIDRWFNNTGSLIEYQVIFSLGIVSFVQIVIGETGVLVLQLVGDNGETGTYKALAELSGAVGFVFIVLNIVYAKKFSMALKLGELLQLEILARKCALVSFIFSLVVSIPFLIAPGSSISMIYGADLVDEGQKVLIWLILSQIINCALGPVMLVATLSGHHNKMVVPLTVGLVISLVLGVVLYEYMGLQGVSIGVLVGLIFWKILVSYILKKNTKIRLGMMLLLNERSV